VLACWNRNDHRSAFCHHEFCSVAVNHHRDRSAREFERCLILAVAIESLVDQIIRRRPNIAAVAKPSFMPQLQTWIRPLKEIKIFILLDGGAMSSWYVLSAMVFYPVCPGSPVCI
jgi:hypothetical protein